MLGGTREGTGMIEVSASMVVARAEGVTGTMAETVDLYRLVKRGFRAERGIAGMARGRAVRMGVEVGGARWSIVRRSKSGIGRWSGKSMRRM